MEQGILAIVILCMFGFGFYIVNKVDQFLDKIQENAKDKPKEEQYSLKILFPDDLSDEELLREVRECKSQYIETEIIIFDGQSESTKKIFDHNIVA
ncbi:putative uncharacterized protein [Clostridium sp. CAG:632]|jgi:hypothetical protein|nr:hypothetical protein [Clostridium sp.]MDD6268393.1 hypothetical protein [Clostridium sp.]CCY58097.1 putative uncharacterized protein [Clostridium sp. CAG:632]